MEKTILAFLLLAVFTSCGLHPKNFTYSYNRENTGLEQWVDINGYYVSRHGCDSSFYSIFRFYPDGLFTIATAGEITPELISCFESGAKNKLCDYFLKGAYILEGNVIKTQVVWPVGNGCTIFRDYRISPEGHIINVSDYVQAGYSNLAYMKNYPSFYENPCEKAALFYPLQVKNDR
jgi:hypothetical protein